MNSETSFAIVSYEDDEMIWHFGHYCVSLWSYDEDHIPDSISGSSHRAGWSPARCIRPAADGGRVPECQSDKRRFWVGSPPPVADYFPSGVKSRWNQNSSDGTQPTASPSCKGSIGKHKQDGEKKLFTWSSNSDFRRVEELAWCGCYPASTPAGF